MSDNKLLFLIIITAVISIVPDSFFKIGPIDFDLFKIFLLITTLFFITTILYRNISFKIPLKSIVYMQILFFAYLLLSSLWAKDMMMALSFSFNQLLYIWFMILIISITTDRESILKWIYAIPLTMVIAFSYDIFMLVNFGTIRKSIEGVLINILAISAEISVLPIVYIYLFRKGIINKLYTIIMLMLSFAVIIVSQNRTAMIVFMFNLLILSFFLLRMKSITIKEKLKNIIIFPILVCIGLFTFLIMRSLFPETISNYILRYTTLFGVEEQSIYYYSVNMLEDNIRFKVWNAAWDMFMQNPVGGVGMGNFSIQLPKYWSISHFITNPHNIYINICAEAGLVGFIIFMILILVIIFNFRIISKYLYRDDQVENYFIVKVFETTFYGILFHSFFRPSLFEFPLYFIMAMSCVCKDVFIQEGSE